MFESLVLLGVFAHPITDLVQLLLKTAFVTLELKKKRKKN